MQNSFNCEKNNLVKNTSELPKEKFLNDSILLVTNNIESFRREINGRYKEFHILSLKLIPCKVLQRAG